MIALNAVSRRQFLAAAGVAASAAWLRPTRLLAHDEAVAGEGGLVEAFRKGGVEAKINVIPLRGNVYVLEGSGGNIGVLASRDGKMLVDAGLATSQPQIARALAGINDAPITHLINTHWHFDHTDGNAWLHEAGAEIIAHENTRSHMSKATRVEPWQHTFPPSPAEALPTIIAKRGATDAGTGMTLYAGDRAIGIDCYLPAHTDGDVVVTFHGADIVQLGDTFWNGHYPFIDNDTGGSIDGTIRAAEVTLQNIGDDTLLIPGHGGVGKKADLLRFHDTLKTIRDRVASLKDQGKSVEDTIAARPTAEFDATWGTFVIDGPTFTRIVFAGV